MSEENSKNEIQVKILNRDYNIKTPLDKVDDLYSAAQYLNTKLAELSDNGKLITLDSIIAIAALNITHELLMQKKQNSIYLESMNQHILEIQNKIDEALAEDSQ